MTDMSTDRWPGCTTSGVGFASSSLTVNPLRPDNMFIMTLEAGDADDECDDESNRKPLDGAVVRLKQLDCAVVLRL